MRRFLSILFIALFGLAPLSALAQGSEDSRLPACCRRNGAHHCAMSPDEIARVVDALAGGRDRIGAPSHCPLYPGAQNARLQTSFALAADIRSFSEMLVSGRVDLVPVSRAYMAPASTLALRGPPAAVLA